MISRLLVGLRWWNEVKDDGENVWIFESKPVFCVLFDSSKIGFALFFFFLFFLFFFFFKFYDS